MYIINKTIFQLYLEVFIVTDYAFEKGKLL